MTARRCLTGQWLVHRRFGSLVLSLTRPGGDVGVCSARFRGSGDHGRLLADRQIARSHGPHTDHRNRCRSQTQPGLDRVAECLR